MSSPIPASPEPAARHSADLAFARRSVLVRKPLHWRVAAALIAELEQAWLALDARVEESRGPGEAAQEDDPT